MPKLPPNNQWTQLNVTDKFGSINYSKNINLDERGYLKLSPRTVTFMNEDENGNFGVPVAIGRYSDGTLLINTTNNASFDSAISQTTRTFSENSGTNNPTMTTDSHGVYFNDLWFATTDTKVVSKTLNGGSSATWTDRITGLTSGKRHYLCVNESLTDGELVVTDGSSIKSHDTSYTEQVSLEINSDYEAVGVAYNNGNIGIITRPATQSTNAKAKFYLWNGTATTAKGFTVDSDAIISITPYKSSFAILTRRGELLYFNGGGFTPLATFPFFITERMLSTATSDIAYGDSMYSEGDRIFINTVFVFNGYGKKDTRYLYNNPSGTWCFDPVVGLYHRYSPSISQAEVFAVTDANINLSTDVFTVSSGTVPATGNPVLYVNNDSTVPTGLMLYEHYYVIKVSDTTFKLATSKENALNGYAIDITAKGTGGTNNFYIYTLLDYGASFVNNAGAIAPMGNTTNFYQGYAMGYDLDDTTLATNDSLCIVTPFLENRGYVVFPKVFSQGKTDIVNKMTVKFRPLKDEDKIIVKVKEKDVIGLPVATPTTGTDEGEYMSKNIVKTSQNISEAKTHIDNGGKLEIEILSGSGAGQMEQVSSISFEDGIYSIVLEDNLDFVMAGDKCHFQLDNWEKVGTITSDDNSNGYADIPIEKSNKFTLIKLEFRGYETTVEDIDWNSDTQVTGT